MRAITSKGLHERTAHCLDRVQNEDRLQAYRSDQLRALLVPPDADPDPDWLEL